MEVDCAGRTGVSWIGYTFTITGDEVFQGNDFGNQQIVTAVPTLSAWAMLALALLLIGLGYTRLRGERAALP
jgi:hypothetical protein